MTFKKEINLRCQMLETNMKTAINNSTNPGMIIIGNLGSGKHYTLTKVLEDHLKGYLTIESDNQYYLNHEVEYLFYAGKPISHLIVCDVLKIPKSSILLDELKSLLLTKQCKKIFFLGEKIQDIPDWCREKSDIFYHGNVY